MFAGIAGPVASGVGILSVLLLVELVDTHVELEVVGLVEKVVENEIVRLMNIRTELLSGAMMVSIAGLGAAELMDFSADLGQFRNHLGQVWY